MVFIFLGIDMLFRILGLMLGALIIWVAFNMLNDGRLIEGLGFLPFGLLVLGYGIGGQAFLYKYFPKYAEKQDQKKEE